MADEPDDVLELEPEADEVTEQEPEAEQSEETESEEIVVGFGDEDGAAPTPESDSSVLRELRRQNREKDRRIRELEALAPAKKAVEVGPEPELASFDYDEEKFKAAWKEWNANKAEAERAGQEAKQRAEAEAQAWAKVVDSYETGKQALGASDFDDAEGEVKAALSPQVQGLLLKSGKGPELVLALGRNPAKLALLSKLDLAESAMMIGELRAKLTMERRKVPQPDRAVTGTAPVGGRTDKELARLEKEADRTGDRTALIRYRKSLA